MIAPPSDGPAAANPPAGRGGPLPRMGGKDALKRCLETVDTNQQWTLLSAKPF
jgi:hypothetical protein